MAELDVDEPDVRAALDVFTLRRLVTISDDTVEVAHEALLREWPRMQQWLQDDRTGLVLRQHLTEAARGWTGAGRDPGELYRGTRLSSALDWTATHSLELNEMEREFLSQSQQASETEAERARRTNRRLRSLLAGVAVFLILALVAGGLAVVQRGKAREQADLAEREATTALAQRLGAQALVTTDYDVSLLLARQGVALDDSRQTRRNLHEALLHNPAAIGVMRPLAGRLLGVSASSDGQLLAVFNNNGQVAFIDPRTREVLSTETGDFAFFGAEGHRAGVVSGDMITIVDPVRGDVTTRRTLPVDTSGFHVSPDFSTLAVAMVDRLRLIDLDTDRTREIRAPRGVRFDDVLYDPAGERLLTTGFTKPDAQDPFAEPLVFSWWDTNPFRLRKSLTHRAASVAISPEGRRLALGTADGSVNIVDLGSGKERLLKGRHNEGVWGLSWSPDGGTLVSGGDDRQVIVWDVAEGGSDETWTGHNGRVAAPAISPDGKTVYTASHDGALIFWDLAGDRRLGRLFPTDPGVALFYPADHVSASPDGKRFALGRMDGLVEVREMRSLRVMYRVQAGTGPVLSVRFSSDGKQLATSANLASVTTWSAADGRRLASMDFAKEPLGERGQNDVERLAYSPDGRVLAGGDDLGRIHFWDPTTGSQSGQPFEVPDDPTIAPERSPAVLGLKFSSDGSMVGAAYVSRASWWRRSDRELVATVEVDDGYGLANALAFSPDGRTVATGGGNGEVRFWNARSGKPARRSILAIAGWVYSLQYDRNGRQILVSGTDGTARIFDLSSRDAIWSARQRDNAAAVSALTPDGRSAIVVYQEGGKGYAWNLDPMAWKRHACAVAGRALTRAEWEQFLPERPYRPACRA